MYETRVASETLCAFVQYCALSSSKKFSSSVEDMNSLSVMAAVASLYAAKYMSHFCFFFSCILRDGLEHIARWMWHKDWTSCISNLITNNGQCVNQ